jgi:Uma2 family endonuclease
MLYSDFRLSGIEMRSKMLVREKVYTLEEFRQFVALPENAGRMFELIHGEIIEVSPGTTRNSEIGHLFTVPVHLFCREHQIPCHTSGGDGAYLINGHVVAPDFAFKRTPMSEEYPDPVPPEWAVEIISLNDKAAEIRQKRQIYLEAGILLWEVYPQARSIDVYAPGQAVRTVTVDGTLDLGAVLSGFSLEVKQLFAS